VFFGRPGMSKGEKSALPQARLVALAECGTHAMIRRRGRWLLHIGGRLGR